MVQLNINELIQILVEYIVTILNDGWMTSLTRTIVLSIAVVWIIMKGAEAFFAEEHPGKVIFLGLWKTSIAIFFIETYDYFFYQVLWQGMIHEVAYNLGTLEVLNQAYQLVMSLVGRVVVGGILSIAGAMGAIFVGGLMLVVCGFCYAVILVGLGEAVLVAGGFLVVGKLLAPLLFFDATSAWFWGWMKGYLGALLGIGMFYFFLGAFNGFPWERAIIAVRSIDDIANSLNQVFNVMVLMVLCGVMALRASHHGSKMLG